MESFGIRPELLLVGLAPVEGVIPAAVLPVGILFCQRERERRGGESLSGSLLSPRQQSFGVFFSAAKYFPEIAWRFTTIFNRRWSVKPCENPPVERNVVYLPQGFMFAVRRKKNEPSRPGLLLLYYSEQLQRATQERRGELKRLIRNVCYNFFLLKHPSPEVNNQRTRSLHLSAGDQRESPEIPDNIPGAVRNFNVIHRSLGLGQPKLSQLRWLLVLSGARWLVWPLRGDGATGR